MDQHHEVQEERSTVTKTTKSIHRVVQHSSESVESSSSLGEFGGHEGSPLSSRKETRQITQIQKMFNTDGDFMMEPLRFLGERFSGNERDFEDVSTQVACLQKQDTFEMKVDVAEYAPDDIQVKVLDDVVMITGKQEIKINENNFKSRSFSKKFSIPPGVTPEKIKCSLSKDGILKISAPIEREAQNQLTQTTVSKVTSSNVSNSSSVTDVGSTTDSCPGICPRKVNPPTIPQELGTFVDDKNFTIRVNVSTQFRAEEIKVKVTKYKITIEGQHESEYIVGHSGHSHRSFYKEYTTNGIKVEQTECTLTTDGILTVTAPLDSSPSTAVDTRQETQVTQTQTQVQKTQQQHVTEQRRQEVTQQVTQQEQQVTQQQQEQLQQEQCRRATETIPQQPQITPTLKDKPQQPAGQPSTQPAGRPSAQPAGQPQPVSRTPQFPADTEEGVEPVQIQPLPKDEPRVVSSSPSSDVPNELSQTNDEHQTTVRVNVTEYTKEELRVRIVKRILVIEGRHEDDFGSRSFLKKVPIPDGVEPKDVTSGLAPNGVLVVKVPLKPSTESPQQSQNVPNVAAQPSSGPTTNVQPQPTPTQQKPVTPNEPTKPQETGDDDFVVVPTQEPSVRPGSPESDAPKEISNVLNEDKYELVLDVSKYRREEITVKVSKTTIRIEGKQTRDFSSRSFTKEHPIPEGVEPSKIQSTITHNGHLTISAPVEKKPAQQAPTPAPQQPQPQAQKEITHKIEQDFSVVNVHEIQRETQQKENTLTKSSSNEETNKVTQFNDGKTFKVVIDVKEYRREEIEIRITKTMIKIEGKHETKFSKKSFYKEVPLPEGVEARSITSEISHDGFLTIIGKVTQTHEKTTQQQQTTVTQQQKVLQQQQQQVTDTQQLQQKTVQQQQVEHRNVHEQQIRSTQTQQQQQQQQQSTTSQRSTTSTQKTTVLKTTLDLNAAKETIEGGHVRDIDRNEKTFTMVYDVSGYGPEDITIRITKYVVTVHGEQKTEFSSRSFNKKFSIPHGVDPRDFQPTLSAEGILTFSAPINHDLPMTS